MGDADILAVVIGETTGLSKLPLGDTFTFYDGRFSIYSDQIFHVNIFLKSNYRSFLLKGTIMIYLWM